MDGFWTAIKAMRVYVRAAYCWLTFALLAGWLAIGVSFTFLFPPFQVPDEQNHLRAAIAKTEKLFSVLKGAEAGSCHLIHGLSWFLRADAMSFHPEIKAATGRFEKIGELKEECAEYNISYGTAFTYPGVLAGRLLLKNELHGPGKALELTYFARLFHGMLIFALLCRLFVLSLKAESSVAKGAVLIALAALFSPLAIQETWAISADWTVFAAALCVIMQMLFARRLTALDWIIVLFVNLVAATTKTPTLPILFLPFFLMAAGLLGPSGNCGAAGSLKERKKILLILALILCADTLAAAWATYSAIPAGGETVSQAGFPIHPGGQVRWMLEHPGQAFLILWGDIAGRASFRGMSSPLGWLDLQLSPEVVQSWKWMVVAASLYATVIAAGTLRFYGLLRIVYGYAILLTLVFLALLAIPLTLYLLYTPVGAARVLGVQSRYYLPIVICAGVALWTIFAENLFACSAAPSAAKDQPRWPLVINSFFTAVPALYLMFYAVSLFIEVLKRYY